MTTKESLAICVEYPLTGLAHLEHSLKDCPPESCLQIDIRFDPIRKAYGAVVTSYEVQPTPPGAEDKAEETGTATRWESRGSTFETGLDDEGVLSTFCVGEADLPEGADSWHYTHRRVGYGDSILDAIHEAFADEPVELDPDGNEFGEDWY